MVVLLNLMNVSSVMFNIVRLGVHVKNMLSSMSRSSMCRLMLMGDHWVMSHVLWMDLILCFNDRVSMFNWLRVMSWSSVMSGLVLHWLMVGSRVMDWLMVGCSVMDWLMVGSSVMDWLMVGSSVMDWLMVGIWSHNSSVMNWLMVGLSMMGNHWVASSHMVNFMRSWRVEWLCLMGVNNWLMMSGLVSMSRVMDWDFMMN